MIKFQIKSFTASGKFWDWHFYSVIITNCSFFFWNKGKYTITSLYYFVIRSSRLISSMLTPLRYEKTTSNTYTKMSLNASEPYYHGVIKIHAIRLTPSSSTYTMIMHSRYGHYLSVKFRVHINYWHRFHKKGYWPLFLLI